MGTLQDMGKPTDHWACGCIAAGGLLRRVLVSFAAAMVLIGAWDKWQGKWNRRFWRSLSILIVHYLEALTDMAYLTMVL